MQGDSVGIARHSPAWGKPTCNSSTSRGKTSPGTIIPPEHHRRLSQHTSSSPFPSKYFWAKIWRQKDTLFNCHHDWQCLAPKQGRHDLREVQVLGGSKVWVVPWQSPAAGRLLPHSRVGVHLPLRGPRRPRTTRRWQAFLSLLPYLPPRKPWLYQPSLKELPLRWHEG